MVKYICEFKLVGIGLKEELCCYYFVGEVSVYLVGVIGIDGYGFEGVECSFDSILMGELGKSVMCKDKFG